MAFDHEKAQESSWRLRLYTGYLDTLASLALVPYHRCVHSGHNRVSLHFSGTVGKCTLGQRPLLGSDAGLELALVEACGGELSDQRVHAVLHVQQHRRQPCPTPGTHQSAFSVLAETLGTLSTV